MNGRLIIISAPSGTGKSTIVREVLQRRPEILCSISCTTRNPRKGEVEGKDYYFISHEEFEKKINNNYFAEWAVVHGEYYGTPIAPIQKSIVSEKDIILDIDVQGAMKLIGLFKENIITIFLLPPSDEILRNRLTKRGTDSKEEVEKRLNNAKKEMIYKDSYQYKVVNDAVEKAVIDVLNILDGKK